MYLDDLFTWVGAHLHDYIYITFFNPVIFDIPQMTLFNGHEKLIQAPDQACMHVSDSLLNVTLSSPKGALYDTSLQLLLGCRDLGWQLLSLYQSRSRSSTLLGTSSSPFDVSEFGPPPLWTSNMDNTQYLELLHFFTAVENLYLSEGVALCIAPAL